MTPMQIAQMLDLAVTLAQSVGMSIERYKAMRDAAGGSLNQEQLAELAAQARRSLDKL